MNPRRVLLPAGFAAILGLWFALSSLRRDPVDTTTPAPMVQAADRLQGRPGPRLGQPPPREGLSLLDWIRGQLRQHAGRNARPNEALLTFRDADAYRRFLAAAGASGLEVPGQLDGLLTVRVRAGSIEALARGLLDHAADFDDLGANFFVFTPQPPAAEARAAQRHVPFGNGMLAFIGVSGDHGLWGRGITIAVLDSGVATDATFGQGRLRHLDVGFGNQPAEGHGTAVAALAAGASADAGGVAPSASILSIRVTDTNGVSDTFTLAQAILAAVDAGARILNISMGSYGSNLALTRALDHAYDRGAVVVASAGNDQADRLTWPAADPRVISVGAVDAIEQQVIFSNSGEQLKVSAPGYGVQTAWLGDQRVTFSGTSASAPIVAGAIAAVMSQSPGLSAAAAWEVLSRYVSEAGAPGADPHFGQGIINLGWAMARNDPTRIDTAVASHYYNADTGRMEVVVQNRSAQGVAGLILTVETSAGTVQKTLPWLGAGATTVVTVPVEQTALDAGTPLIFRSVLANPAGLADEVPANNRKTSSLQLAAP